MVGEFDFIKIDLQEGMYKHLYFKSRVHILLKRIPVKDTYNRSPYASPLRVKVGVLRVFPVRSCWLGSKYNLLYFRQGQTTRAVMLPNASSRWATAQETGSWIKPPSDVNIRRDMVYSKITCAKLNQSFKH